MGESHGMEMQGVRLDMFKIKGIKTRSRADWLPSGAQSPEGSALLTACLHWREYSPQQTVEPGPLR